MEPRCVRGTNQPLSLGDLDFGFCFWAGRKECPCYSTPHDAQQQLSSLVTNINTFTEESDDGGTSPPFHYSSTFHIIKASFHIKVTPQTTQTRARARAQTFPMAVVAIRKSNATPLFPSVGRRDDFGLHCVWDNRHLDDDVCAPCSGRHSPAQGFFEGRVSERERSERAFRKTSILLGLHQLLNFQLNLFVWLAWFAWFARASSKIRLASLGAGRGRID